MTIKKGNLMDELKKIASYYKTDRLYKSMADLRSYVKVTLKDEKERLEKIASYYRTGGLYKKLVGYGFRTILPHFKPGDALEVGAADGAMTKLAHRYFKNYHIVEGSKTFCDMLRKMFPFAVVFEELIEDLDPIKTYDNIILAHVLEHVEDPVYVLRHLMKFAKAGTVLFIIVPNANSIHRLAAVEMGILKHPQELAARDYEVGHRRVYTKDDLISDINESADDKSYWHVREEKGILVKPIHDAYLSTLPNHILDAYYELAKIPHLAEHAAEICLICEKKK